MARKIDWSKGKELLFNHGEKIALGSCAFIAIVLGLWGVWNARSAGRADGGKTWPQAFDGQSTRIKNEMAGAPLPVIDGAIFDVEKYKWASVTSKHTPSAYTAFSEGNSDKRDKPRVLPILDDPKKIQLKYLSGLVYLHDNYTDRSGNKLVRGLESASAVVAPPVQPPPKNLKGAPAAPLPLLPFAQVGEPRRMVVVHAVFPMRKQMEEFRRALRLNDQGDMLVKNPDDLPKVMGIDVQRIQIDPQGKTTVVHLLGYDKDNNFKIQPELEKLLREAIYDERSPEAFKSYLFAGLSTPMPKLGNRPYPKFNFPDFDDIEWALFDEAEKKDAGMLAMQPPPKEVGGPGPVLPGKGKRPPDKMPPPEMGPKTAATDYKLKDMPELTFKDSHPVLISRLFPSKQRPDQDFNVYHVLGEFPRAKDAVAAFVPGQNQTGQDRYQSAWSIDPPTAGGAPGTGGPGLGTPLEGGGRPKVPKEGGGGPVTPPAAPAHPDWKRDALVRFVDVDVQPGYTYSYAIRVRLANPNFGKEAKEVAFALLASSPTLDPSDWVKTESIAIPHEYFLYAVDQQLVDETLDNKAPDSKRQYPANFFNNYAPFQIHQWVDRRTNNILTVEPFVIGDWAIAERQYVKRGDYIGKNVVVEIPVWNKLKDSFDVPQLTNIPEKGKQPLPKGAHLHLMVDDKAPILVDFTGGKRLKTTNTLDEETAVDALVLMPDGKLKLFNSRDASEVGGEPAINPEARQRQDRVLQNRERVREIKTGGSGPGLPKEGPGPKLPIPPKGGGAGGSG